MNFLLDVNIPPTLKKLLIAKGHNCRTVVEIGQKIASDISIIEIAQKGNEVIITHDLDFSSLLAIGVKSKPSVIQVRINKVNALLIFKLITENWNSIEQPLLDGAIISFAENNLRIRGLPLRK